MKTTDIRYKEERALDIMNGSAKPNEADVNDDCLLSCCRDLEEAAFALDNTHVDVEERLQQFHGRHSSHKMTILWGIIAAAACITGLLFILHKGNDKVNLNASPIAYSKVRSLKTIEIIGGKGESIKGGSLRSTAKVFDVMDAKPSDVVLTAAIPTGDNYEVRLSDGTRVLLHGNSRLVFPSRFEGDNREVRLDGQAYFIVKHDPDHPFIVHAGKMTTEVLGTEFYARADGKNNDVTLIKGQVKVETSHQAYKMFPGQQVIVTADGKAKARGIDISPYEYWRDGYFYFDQATLIEIADDIAEEYGLKVEYRATNLPSGKIRFISDRTKGIESVLTDLNDITGLNIKVVSTSLIIQ